MAKPFTPRPYQETAIERLKKVQSGGLFLDMGLGKTAVVLSYLYYLFDSLFSDPILVIAPKKVCSHRVWEDQIAEWEQFNWMTTTTIEGGPKQREKKLQENTHIHIINYELLDWLVNHYKRKWPYKIVIADESHHLKSPTSKRFRALKRVRGCFDHFIGMSGTPAPKGYIDLWSQVYLMDLGERLYPTLGKYRKKFFDVDFLGYTWTPKDGAEDAIKRRISDICIFMDSEDHLDLPEFVFNPVYMDLPKSVREIYDSAANDLVLQIESGAPVEDEDDADVIDTSAIASMKLRQIAGGSVIDTDGETHHLHDAKLEALDLIIDEMNGKPLLVATHFVADKQAILARYEGAELLTDDTDVKERWNRREIPILVANPQSSSEGLNLQKGGNNICWFGLTWSLRDWLQFNKRLHRMGQESTVFCHAILARNTVDEHVYQRLLDRKSVQDGLLEFLKPDNPKTCRQSIAN